ncbi:MAG: hypothetical protein AAB592_01430 [Patescibacteria group bacterium]
MKHPVPKRKKSSSRGNRQYADFKRKKQRKLINAVASILGRKHISGTGPKKTKVTTVKA